MANNVDPVETLRAVSSGSSLFEKVSVLVCRDDRVKREAKKKKKKEKIQIPLKFAHLNSNSNSAFSGLLQRYLSRYRARSADNGPLKIYKECWLG